MNNAKYVVFDGMDGSGKGTQLKLLEEKCHPNQVLFTREPGGPPLAEEVRKIIRDNPLAGQSTALFHFLMFWGAREESMHKRVMPVLLAGKHVFSDRGDSSTYAFQIYGENHKELLPQFASMRKRVFDEKVGRHSPDLYIVFDLPAEVARERALQDANRTKTHFDIRDLAYYQRVRTGFRKFAKKHPVMFINAVRAPEEVHRSVILTLAEKSIIPEFAFVV